MPQQPSLIDKLLDQKANRPAAQTYEGVSQWWKQSFGGEMPVKNIGESEFERRNQHEHSRAFDVGINPNSAQGQRFIKYLQAQGIPYSAFDKAITRNGVVIASGPHIHVGIPSPRLGTSQPAESLVDRLLKAKDGQQEVKGDYLNQGVEAAKSHTASLDKLAHDIEWHFGYGVLQAFPKLPEDKQKQIAQLATQYAASDEVKKKNGQLITKSSAWQELNRRRVQLQLPDVLNPEEEQQQEKMEKDAYARRTNPLLQLGSKSRWLMDMLATGGAGLYEFAAGALNQAANAATLETRRLRKQPDLIDKAVGALRSGAATVRNVSAEAEAVEPTGKVSKLIKGAGSGAVEYAPMLAMPELGIEGVLAKIGTSAAAFGGYSGLQASGRGESAGGVAKETVTGGALGALFGVPLPGKSILTKGLSNLVIMGGGGTVVNLATGKSLSDSATQGLALMLLRSPELLHGIKVRDANGERPATVSDLEKIKSVIPGFSEEMQLRAAKDAKFQMTPEERAKFIAERKGQSKPEVKQPTTFTDVDSPERIAERAKQQRELSSVPAEDAKPTTTDKFAGQEGVVNVANLPGVRTVLKAQQTASAVASKKGVWDFMRYTRDVADNKARIFGQTNSRELDIKLRRSLGLPKWGLSTKTQALAQDALTFVVESNGNPAELQAMRQKIAASTQALPGWKKRSLRAIDFAEQNYGKLAPVAQEYNTLTDAQRTRELSNGVKSYYRPGYVMHAQEIEGEMGWLEGGSGTGSSGFRHQRTYDTYADSIAAGINPKSLNAVDLLRTRLTNGQSMINRRAWVDSLRTTVDPKTTLPVVNKVTIDPVTHVAEAPAGYSVESVGPQQVAVQKGYEGLFKAINDPSAFRKNAGTRLLTSANAAGKSYSLVFDTYHLGRLSTWNSILRLSNLKNPNPFSFGKGITLLDTSLPMLQDMVQRGELKAADYPHLAQSKANLDLLVDNGYNVGNISDAIYSDIVHRVPLAGDFNKWLFGQFQRGAMSEVGLMEFAKRRAARAAYETEAQSARYVAKKLNTRFGNFGRQGWIKSATFQDAARLIALAPQWNEGLIKSEFGAVTETGKAVVEMFQGKPFYVGPLARSVGTLAVGQFVGNQIINMITRGHPTWMNQEEGWGSKISAWVPDFVSNGPGFFIHPFGLAAETSLLLTKGYERAAGVMKAGGSKTDQVWSWLSAVEGDTLDYLRSRSSILMRPVWTGVSGKDYMNKPIKPEDRFKQTLKDAIPRPLPAPAIYDAIFGTQYPGELQGRLMQSFGIRTERAPSGEQRIRTLARQFNQAHGVEKQGEFYDSPYAAVIQNPTPETVKELLKSHTKDQITKYFDNLPNKPVTGSGPREIEFKKTLNAEQMEQYKKLKGARYALRDAVQNALNQIK